ncbi:autotransporter-associated beta strand repeat-containing protein, partial [Chelativorans sp. YIM 93263]|uniref:autotransporter-associated beta strand repeat-containing protein n=1 Tax=Chelativorans sp. YIM 93263 TaxID=2906648 RepID=UPI0023796BA2
MSTALAVLTCVTADFQLARAQSVSGSGHVVPGMPTPPLATWDLNDKDLFVGLYTVGELSIEDGGKVSNVDGYIAYAVGSGGTVTVTGSGSTWTNSGKLRVGSAGDGTLIIKDGGKVSNLDGSIGTGAGHTSTATVSGDGSTWTNSGNLTIGNYGTGTLTIDDGGKVSADHVVLGLNSGSGTVNLNGSTGSGRGVLETAYVANSGDGTVALNFDGGILRATENQASYLQNFGDITLGTGGLWFDTNSFDISIGADTTFSGTSSINKIGPGTLSLIGDNSGFTGATTVSGGTLLVGDTSGSGTLGGTVTVENGGTVGGSGTIGAVTLASGATVAPGNSIGTLNVAGDITFSSGSTDEVEVDPAGADSDSIHATGMAHLNDASVVHVGLDGSYDPFSSYTILTADGGIDGTFGDVTSVYAFLTSELSYGANTVDLILTRNDIDFVDKARTRNQRATAEGAESLDPGNEVYNAIAALPDTDAVIRDSFDQLSGEIHASAKTA